MKTLFRTYVVTDDGVGRWISIPCSVVRHSDCAAENCECGCHLYADPVPAAPQEPSA